MKEYVIYGCLLQKKKKNELWLYLDCGERAGQEPTCTCNWWLSILLLQLRKITAISKNVTFIGVLQAKSAVDVQSIVESSAWPGLENCNGAFCMVAGRTEAFHRSNPRLWPKVVFEDPSSISHSHSGDSKRRSSSKIKNQSGSRKRASSLLEISTSLLQGEGLTRKGIFCL
eukprot:TRINITY_DN12143_c0_g1_i2.p1 TRINITY_DN12143_c0_g1~~TRINITY_DN12143_c0_g1_i2.p1  ORF type:complete len:171 (-),score=4.91 TRINITY_DN12143_c0_g1_i2:620-1132(-)